MKYNRFLPLFTPLVIWLLLEIFYLKHTLIYVYLVFSSILLFFTIRQFVLSSTKDEKVWDLFILPFIFNIGLVTFSIFISRVLVVQFLFFLDIVFLYIFLRKAYYYLNITSDDKKESLENLYAFGGFLAIFFISASIYGLESFLKIPIWILILFLLFFVSLNIYQIIWVNKIVIGKSMVHIAIASFVLVEIGWTLYFLPLSFYILGLIFAVFYYILSGIIKHYLLDNLDSKIIKIFLGLGFFCIVILLFTTRWL